MPASGFFLKLARTEGFYIQTLERVPASQHCLEHFALCDLGPHTAKK